MRFFGVLAVYGPGRFPYRRFGMRGPLSGPALSQTRPFRRPGSLSNPALPQARSLPAHTKVIQTLGRAKFLICFFSRGRGIPGSGRTADAGTFFFDALGAETAESAEFFVSLHRKVPAPGCARSVKRESGANPEQYLLL